MPFTGFYFGQISIFAVIANLVVVPVSGINVLLGFTTVAFSFLNDWIASCYAALDDLLVSLLLKFVLWCSKMPFAYVETPTVGGMFTLFYYTGATALFGLRKPRILMACGIVVLTATNVMVYVDVLSQNALSLTATVIDVGQGDSILLELPQKRAILIDTGPKVMQNDSGERFVAPLLKRKGIGYLDAIILTHPHDDHIGGCKYLLENFKPRMLLISDSTLPSRPYRELLAIGKALAIPIRIAREGESLQFDSTTRIFVLHAAPRSRPRDLNDQSIVLKVVYGTSSLLLTGDASERVEQDLLGCGRSLLPSEALKVGHHGAITSSSDEFLRAVRPEEALISVGRENKFKHPSPVILSRLEAHGIETRRTDLSGALVLKSNGESFRIEQWRPQHVLSFF
jgi:competence protein ComEC